MTSSTNKGIAQAYAADRAIAKVKPFPVITNRDPTTTDLNYILTQEWLNKSTQTLWFLGAKTGGSATWIAAGSGATGGVVTVTGDSGGALSPSSGNINLKGTANQIAVAGAGSTETWSLSATLVAPGSITATTSLTATLGDITATNGNIVKGTAGNKDVYSSVASNTTAGANSAGSVALVAGTATVNTSAVTANSLIRLTVQALGTVLVPQAVAATAKVANTSFTITSADATDTSTVFWEIVN